MKYIFGQSLRNTVSWEFLVFLRAKCRDRERQDKNLLKALKTHRRESVSCDAETAEDETRFCLKFQNVKTIM